MQPTLQQTAPPRTTPKTTTVLFWIFTALFCLQMSFTAYAELRLPQVAEAFNRSAVEIADRINALRLEVPKYVIAVEAGATGGLPAPVQTIMFLTRSYTKKQQEQTNIRYLTRQSATDPEGVAFCQQVAAPLTQGEVFCLQVNRESPPVF